MSTDCPQSMFVQEFQEFQPTWYGHDEDSDYLSGVELEKWFESAHECLLALQQYGISSTVVVFIATSIVEYIATLTIQNTAVCKLLNVAIESPMGMYCDPDMVIDHSDDGDCPTSLAKVAANSLPLKSFVMLLKHFRPHYTMCMSANLDYRGGKECSCVDSFPGMLNRYGNTVNYYPLCLFVTAEFLRTKLQVMYELYPRVTRLFLFRYAALYPVNAHIEDGDGMLAKCLGTSNFEIPTKYLLPRSEHESSKRTIARNLTQLQPYIWTIYKDAMGCNLRLVAGVKSIRYHQLESKIHGVQKMPTDEGYAQSVIVYLDDNYVTPLDKLFLYIAVLSNTGPLLCPKLLKVNSVKLAILIREGYRVTKSMYDRQIDNSKDKSGEFLMHSYANGLRTLIVHTSYKYVFENIEKLHLDVCVPVPMCNLVAICMTHVMIVHMASNMEATFGVPTVISIMKNPSCFELPGGPLMSIIRNSLFEHYSGKSITEFIDRYIGEDDIQRLLLCRDEKNRNLLHHLVTVTTSYTAAAESMCKWIIKHNSTLLCQEDCLYATPLSYRHDVDTLIDIQRIALGIDMALL